jgi:hypothetical protein
VRIDAPARRFLIVAPAFLEWDLGRYLEQLLAARGLESERFAYLGYESDAEANERLLEAVEEYRPDVVLGLKMGLVTPQTVRRLRERGAFVLLWYVDCWDGEVPKEIGALFKEVDLFLTTAAGMLPRYCALAPTPAHWVYEGAFLPAFPAVEPAPAVRKLYASEVAFIGNLFNHPPVGDEALSLRRYRLLSRICERHRLKIWGQQGDPNAAEKWPFPQCPVIYWPAFHEEVVKICRASDIILGINTVNTVERYFSNRTFLTLASGGFHLTHYVPGLETMFENHRHLVWYHSDDECLELIEHYLPREDERMRIAREGRAWTRRRYGMGRQLGRILKLVAAYRGR